MLMHHEPMANGLVSKVARTCFSPFSSTWLPVTVVVPTSEIRVSCLDSVHGPTTCHSTSKRADGVRRVWVGDQLNDAADGDPQGLRSDGDMRAARRGIDNWFQSFSPIRLRCISAGMVDCSWAMVFAILGADTGKRVQARHVAASWSHCGSG